MGEFGRDFLKSTTHSDMDLESILNYIIDNYPIIMKKYRVIQAHIQETALKKEYAHEQLLYIREIEEKIYQSNCSLTEPEKIELEEAKYYWTSIREEDDLIFYDGSPMASDEMAYIIKKYSWMIRPVEKIDSKIRKTLFKAFSFVHGKTSKVVKNTAKSTTNAKTKKFINFVKELNDRLPQQVEDALLSDCVIDLSDHRPVE